MSVAPPGASAASTRRLARGFNRLGTELYRRLPEATNTFFSPLSLGIALTALAPGARGATAREIEALLGLNDIDGSPGDIVARILNSLARTDETESFTLHVANALFTQHGYPVLETYREVLRESFRADSFSIDYGRPAQAADEINRWVAERTRGKITEIVSQEMLPSLTRLVLTNAVYFRAKWVNQFEPLRTQRWPFQRLDPAPPLDVDMMQETLTLAFWRDEELGVSAVGIPYRGGSMLPVSMFVVLPDTGRLGAVEADLGGGLLDRMASHVLPTLIHLRLPRFKLRMSLQVGELLQELGLRAVFDSGQADFSGITDHPDGLFVSDMVHEACVEVDENGTEAAAATAVVFAGLGLPEAEPDPIQFTVDRPFIFLIRDDATGMTDPGA